MASSSQSGASSFTSISREERKWAIAVWVEGGLEVQECLPSHWVSQVNGLIYWPPKHVPSGIAISKWVYPNESWLQFPLKKVRLADASKELCNQYILHESSSSECGDTPRKLRNEDAAITKSSKRITPVKDTGSTPAKRMMFDENVRSPRNVPRRLLPTADTFIQPRHNDEQSPTASPHVQQEEPPHVSSQPSASGSRNYENFREMPNRRFQYMLLMEMQKLREATCKLEEVVQHLGRRIEPESSSFFLNSMKSMDQFNEMTRELLADPEKKKMMLTTYLLLPLCLLNVINATLTILPKVI